MFIRAVNVGGAKLPMAELRGLAEDLGATDVSTYIASGNLLCTPKGAPARFDRALEKAIEDKYGYFREVISRTPAQLRAALDAHPFDVVEDRYSYVYFLAGKPTAKAVKAFEDTAFADADVKVIGEDLHIRYRDGAGPLRPGCQGHRQGAGRAGHRPQPQHRAQAHRPGLTASTTRSATARMPAALGCMRHRPSGPRESRADGPRFRRPGVMVRLARPGPGRSRSPPRPRRSRRPAGRRRDGPVECSSDTGRRFTRWRKQRQVVDEAHRRLRRPRPHRLADGPHRAPSPASAASRAAGSSSARTAGTRRSTPGRLAAISSGT